MEMEIALAASHFWLESTIQKLIMISFAWHFNTLWG